MPSKLYNDILDVLKNNGNKVEEAIGDSGQDVNAEDVAVEADKKSEVVGANNGNVTKKDTSAPAATGAVAEGEDKEVEKVLEEISKIKIENKDFGAIFEGTELTDEFKAKAITIFEAAVNEKLSESVKRGFDVLREHFQAAYAEEVSKLTEATEKYADHVAEEWLKENKLAVETGLRQEMMESIVEGIKKVFLENYVELPEKDTTSELEALKSKVKELEESVKKEMDKNISLKEEAKKQEKVAALSDFTKGMTAIQADKVKQLSESVEFTSVEEFTKKLTSLKENFIVSASPKKGQALTEDGSAATVESTTKVESGLTPEMAKYVKAATAFGARK